MIPTFCVFNRTRESFMALNAVRADSLSARLRGLLGRMKFAPEDGLWLTPSVGVHTFGMLFSIDVFYLDDAMRVIHLVEHLDPFRISPIRQKCAGILILRTRTIYSSHTKIGDELIVCTPEEMQVHLAEMLRAKEELQANEGPVAAPALDWQSKRMGVSR